MLEGNGLVIPSIELRSSEDLSELRSGLVSFDYLFNRELFVSRLSTACPRISIYNTIDEAEQNRVKVYHYPSTLTGMFVTPRI
jgi:hypothetical protein